MGRTTNKTPWVILQTTHHGSYYKQHTMGHTTNNTPWVVLQTTHHGSYNKYNTPWVVLQTQHIEWVVLQTQHILHSLYCKHNTPWVVLQTRVLGHQYINLPHTHRLTRYIPLLPQGKLFHQLQSCLF